jgi:16S rRNA (uracil1498-N3)-methyltransferase
MAVPRFLVSAEQLTGASATLGGAELRHVRVRRLRQGDVVILIDGAGHERHGVITLIARDHATVHFDQPFRSVQASASPVTLAQAIIKPDKLDLIIEKATELGVAEVVLITAERSRPIGDLARRIARWERLCASAAKQSARADLPRITGPVPFAQLLDRAPSALRLLFWEAAPVVPIMRLQEELAAAAEYLVTIGPEGGFTDAEAQTATTHGFRLLRLNLPTLRSETASILAVALATLLGQPTVALAPLDTALARQNSSP